MAINLGDIVYGLGPDTSRLRTAVRDILDLGDTLDQMASGAVQATSQVEAGFRKQEAAIVSALKRMQDLNNSARSQNAPAGIVTNSQNAFKGLTNELARGLGSPATPLEYQRAMEKFNVEMINGKRALAEWAASAQPATTLGGKFAEGLRSLSAAASLTTGPLGGVASRMNIISNMLDNGGLGLAVFVGGIAAATYGFLKFSESAVRVEEGLLRMRMGLTALSGSTAIAQTDMNYLLQVAQQFGVPLEDVAAHFTKIELASRGTSLEGSKIRDVFKEIITYGANMGSTQNQIDASLNIVTSSLTRQRITWRDIRGELSKEFPAALEIGARAMDMTVANFDRAVKRGDIIAQNFWPKFFAEANKTQGFDSSKAVDNLFSSQGNLKNSFLEFNNALNSALGFSDRYKTSLDNIRGAVDYLRDNIGQFIKVAGAIGGAMIAGLLAPKIVLGVGTLINGIISMTRAISAFGVATAFATGGLSLIIGAGAALVAGIGAYKLLDSVVNQNKSSLLGAMPTIDAYIKAHDDMKKSASSATAEMLKQASATLLVAQANVAAAQGALDKATKDSSKPVTKEGAEAAADSWWSWFSKKIGSSGFANTPEAAAAIVAFSKKAVADATAQLDEKKSTLNKLQEQIVTLNKIFSQQSKTEKGNKGDPLEETDQQKRMRLATKEMQQFLDESAAMSKAMSQGPKAIQSQTETAAIEKSIESWRDKLQRAGFTASEVKSKMLELTDVIKKLKDQELFDKNFVFVGKFIADAFQDATKQGVDKFIDALNSGKLKAFSFRDTMLSVLGSIEKKFFELAILNPMMNSLFGGTAQTLSMTAGGTGIGGIIGKIFGMSMHGGSGSTSYTSIDPNVFAGARRYHSGLMPDEFPAILQDGEEVIPRGGRGRGGDTYTIDAHYHDHKGGQDKASQKSSLGMMRKELEAMMDSRIIESTRHGGVANKMGMSGGRA